MKNGFYLSPDGLHILELWKDPKTSIVYKVYDDLARGYEDYQAAIVLYEYEVIYLFSAWEILE